VVLVSPREIAFLTNWEAWRAAILLALLLMVLIRSGVTLWRYKPGIQCGPCNDGICDSLGCAIPGMCICDEHEENTMAGKRYGTGAQNDLRLKVPYEFEVAGLRYDDEEVHEFTAVRKVDTLLAARFIDGEDGAVIMRTVVQLIGKTLDNKDGVPIQWSPDQLPKPKDADDDWEPKFRAPDGNLYPMADAVKFTDFNAGSSRRRWAALVDDQEFTVAIETLAAIGRDLIGESAGRPTDG
jgi:hypothetical protein